MPMFDIPPDPYPPPSPLPPPILNLGRAELSAILDEVPHWHACLLGPVPLGGTERVGVCVGYMVVPTREEAESLCWQHVEGLCEAHGVPLDPERWELLRLVEVGCN